MPTDGETLAIHSVIGQRRFFKFLFVGDSDCGKTRIIQTYLQKIAPKTITHDTISTSYEYEHRELNATFLLVDVRGTHDIARAAERFSCTNVAIFFYAINDFKSLQNLIYLWLPRFRMLSGFNIPTILVGNKKDLRGSEGLRAIASLQPASLSFLHGMKAKNSGSMDMFLECSAEDNESIDRIFQTAYSYVI